MPDVAKPGDSLPDTAFGQAPLSTSQLDAGGFDVLTIASGDAILFSGDATLRSGRAITLSTAILGTVAGAGTASIIAPYVTLTGTGNATESGADLPACPDHQQRRQIAELAAVRADQRCDAFGRCREHRHLGQSLCGRQRASALGAPWLVQHLRARGLPGRRPAGVRIDDAVQRRRYPVPAVNLGRRLHHADHAERPHVGGRSDLSGGRDEGDRHRGFQL